MYTNPFDEIIQRLSKIEALQQQSLNAERDQNDLIDIAGAAIYLRKAKATIYCKVSKGQIPYMKEGSRLWFSKRELNELIKAGRKTVKIQRKKP